MSIEKIMPMQQIQPLSSIEKMGETSSGGSTIPFADMLSDAMNNMTETQTVIDENNVDLLTSSEADLHKIMMDTAMNTLAVETAVEISSRAVSAYKEIMSMQI